MRILNFGSLNIDHVYGVDHFVRPGETIASRSYHMFQGGKGGNQSIALARAGAEVFHAGRIGNDGAWLREKLRQAGVNVSLIGIEDGATGHAIIQVNREGENSIVLHGGANHRITPTQVRESVRHFGPGDFLLLQNEISHIPWIMKQASRQSMRIVFNPAPLDHHVSTYPLHLVDLFVLNAIEGTELTSHEEPRAILHRMREQFPRAATVLTLGRDGVLYADGTQTLAVPAVRVKAVDTTAAGDTFIGYFLAGLATGKPVEVSLRTACRAAAICVTRPGAADSIPTWKEVVRIRPAAAQTTRRRARRR